MTTLDDFKLLIVEPCNADERVFMRAVKGRGQLHIMYEDVLKKLNSQFPFTDFECEMLSLMNVAPVQLHPNSWAFCTFFKFFARVSKSSPLLISSCVFIN